MNVYHECNKCQTLDFAVINISTFDILIVVLVIMTIIIAFHSLIGHWGHHDGYRRKFLLFRST